MSQASWLQQWTAHRFIESQRNGHWESYQLPGRLEKWAEEMVRNRKGAVSISQLRCYLGHAVEDAWSHLLGNSQCCHHHLGLQKSWLLCLLPWLQSLDSIASPDSTITGMFCHSHFWRVPDVGSPKQWQWQPPQNRQMSTMFSPHQRTRFWWWWWFCLRWAPYSPPFVADADLELLIFLPSAGITYTAVPSDIWILC